VVWLDRVFLWFPISGRHGMGFPFLNNL